MPMCPIHYPTSWFPTAFIFSTTSTSGPQNAGASRQSQQLAGRTVLYLEKWARIIDSGSWIQWQDANWNWRKSFARYHHPVRDSCTKESRRAYSQGGANPCRQGTYCRSPSNSSGRGILLDTVFGAKERGPTQASGQPSSSEQVCKSRVFQNGGDAHCERPPAGGRLDDTTRFEGCIICNSCTQAPPEVSPIQMEEQELIPVPFIRSVHSSTYVHQGFKSSDRLTERIGHQVCDIPGGHSHHEPGQGAGSPTDMHGQRSTYWSP